MAKTRSKPADEFEFVEDGLKKVSLVFGFTIFSPKPLSSFGKKVLSVFSQFQEICPEGALNFYVTESMTKHAAVNARALGMLSVWFGPKASSRDFIGVTYQASEKFNAAPTWGFEIFGEEGELEPPYSASMVRWSVPGEWADEHHDDLVDHMKYLCSSLPWQSGYASYAFACSRYFEEEAGAHALAKAVRHPGIEYHNTVVDGRVAGHDGIRAVGWLTALDEGLLKRLGGTEKVKKKLPKAVEWIDVPGGVILKAGPAPKIGDVNRKDNLPEYRAVYNVIEPLTEESFERSTWFEGDDDGTRTAAFLRRFGK